MQSVRSKIIIWLLRNRHLLKLKLTPEIVDAGFSVEKFREDVDRASSRIKMPKGVTIKKEAIGSMEAEWVVPEAPLPGKVLLYIHGGGFISGSLNTHRMHVAKFAKGCGVTALLFNYRLAPEHPFPAAPDDCLTAYRWLLDKGCSPKDIVVGGESAGGTLTLSLLLTLKEEKVDFPAAAFSISPVTDLRCQAASFSYNAKKDIAPMGSWDVWTKMYIGENDPVLPPLSPLNGNFRGVPPLHICVGTCEIHLEDCIRLAEKARAEGVKVSFSKWPKMVHAFPIMSPLFPEARKAMGDICEFVVKHIE